MCSGARKVVVAIGVLWSKKSSSCHRYASRGRAAIGSSREAVRAEPEFKEMR